MDDRKDPWRGIRVGDRFYKADWNAQNDVALWDEVTDLWFDPVRGQHSKKRGYVCAVRLMGRCDKTTVAASTLVGRRYVNKADADAKAATVLEDLMGG
jgi:hypothetical protein